MNESEALLIVERGPIPATQIPLHDEQLTIGRSAGNDLVLADPEVSRRHVRLVRRNDGFAIEDSGSTNGTFVNGQRISHLTLLQDGDAIDLGEAVRLRYMRMAQATPDSPVDLADKPTQNYSPAAYQDDSPQVIVPQAVAHLRPEPARPVNPDFSVPATPAVEYVASPPPTFATAEPERRGRGLMLGCGLIMAMLLVCAGTFLVLDAYDQGRLLYCGPLSSIFETILGPFGFAPICP